MSATKMFPAPAWMEPDKRQWFAIKLAALYHNKAGSVSELSVALGGSSTMLHMAVKQSGLTPNHCIQLEHLLTRELFPREFFRPDIFVAE